GRRLRNRYKITEHLGDGSTATVYKALDERLERDVALKLLLPHVRETTRKRFFQEATSAAQLNHPNIMAIFDMDEDDDRHFLVTEYVDGVSLTQYVPSSPELVVDLGVQIALALQYAHERQIIHRDIKPANIKVTPEGKVKIMDLGLALPREAKRVTATGMVIGTPAYLSPEQAQGLKLDHRTDIYSLGIVLYEMATGQLPFNADDIGALLLQQVKQPPPPLRLIVADLPMALEAVILKSLEKNPSRRFQSCAAFASSLSASIAPGDGDDGLISTPNATSTSQLPRTQPSGKRSTLRVVLADDHTLMRRSLAGLLETHDEFLVVGEAGNGDDAISVVLNLKPDILVLDLNMPGKTGLEVLPVVRKEAPSVKVLVLTGRDEDAYIMRALRAGAHGYMLKSADETDLLEALGKVSTGQLILGRGVAEKVVTGALTGGAAREDQLNDLEQSIIIHIAAGYENDEIAKILGVSMMELIEKIARIMDKLDAKDRNTAALKAIRLGEVLIEDIHMMEKVD
ncbi:MAG: protein kinase, partial [Aggregatilineales bacterium]